MCVCVCVCVWFLSLQLDRVRGRVLTSDEAIRERMDTIQEQKQSEMDENDRTFQVCERQCCCIQHTASSDGSMEWDVCWW